MTVAGSHAQQTPNPKVDQRECVVGLLSAEERKDRIRKQTKDLGNRFDELLWGNPARLQGMRQLNPAFFDTFWDRFDELDRRYVLYLEGTIDWEDAALVPSDMDPRMLILVVAKDVATFARDLFSFVVLEVEKIK